MRVRSSRALYSSPLHWPLMQCLLLLAISILVPFQSSAQKDSLTITDFASFREQLLRFNPVALRSNFIVQAADGRFLAAQGGFDPKIAGDFLQKDYNQSTYYSYVNGQVKLPLWFGPDLKAGFERASGRYINPEATVPDQGLLLVGFNMPVLSGLWFDSRRWQYRQAQISLQSTQALSRLMINDLVLDGSSAFLQWQWVQQVLSVKQLGMDFALERLTNIKEAARLGDLAFIDTVDASLQYQSRFQDFNQTRQVQRSSELMLGTYWFEADTINALNKYQGLILSQKQDNLYALFLDEYIAEIAKTSVDSAVQQHPSVQMAQLKVNELEVDRKLKNEKRKPKLDVETGLLSNPALDQPLSLNNIKVGASLEFPLFFRQGRGEVAEARAKIKMAELDRVEKSTILKAKIMQYLNELQILKQNIDLNATIVASAKRMRDAELDRFMAGDGNQFMVNARELKYLEYLEKDAEYKFKFMKAFLGWKWATAQLD